MKTPYSIRSSKRIWKRDLLALAIAGLTLTTIAGCGKSESQPSRGGQGGDRGVTPVEVLVLKLQPVENNIITTGTLLANEEVELRPEISGRVTGIFFEEGKKVRKGDLLIKLNDRMLQAELKRKQLEEALASDDERRQRSLLGINGISQEDYDKVLNSLNMIKAEREVIESQLAETEIFTPFDGVIGLRYVSEGSVISPSTLIATMQDIDPVKVEFSIPERYAGSLKTGTEVAVEIGDASEIFEGEVYAMESKVDLATRTLKARATIPNAEGRLIPGSFCKVKVTLERIPDAMVIPAEALVPELNGHKVFICENGEARSIPVTTGIRTDRDIQIARGLKPNDTLILTGLLQLSDGKPVQIKSHVAK